MTEMVDQVSSIIEEDTSSGEKRMFLEGIFLQDTLKNRNGRAYPKNVMTEAVRKYKTDYIDTKRSISELNHPTSPQVNPERASHMITSIKESGNNWIGRAKILNTPMGSIVKNLINDGVSMGVSSRGLGAVKESGGTNVVQSGYYITAIDVVSDPSAPDAFVNGIMENKEWIFENGILIEREIDMIQKLVDEGVKCGMDSSELHKTLFERILMKL